MEMETAENRNKKSKIGFYVHYDWGFNLTHDIVSFLQQIANDFKHELIQYYKTRATELLEKAEKESDYVDDFPKHDRFLRMKDVAPEMYDGIADGTFLLEGGYRKLTREEVIGILKESM